MLRRDCRFCGENVFDVVDIEHLGTLPHSWFCQGCGREYIGELDDSGRLIVYQKGYKPQPRQPKKTAKAAAPPAFQAAMRDESPEPKETAKKGE